MTAHLVQLPPNFYGEVHLFPLTDAVLVPGTMVPLRIFESRYRQMFEDAIQSDQHATMCTLLPGFGHEYYGRPPIAPVVCMGRVADWETTIQDTHNLMLAGRHRARIENEIELLRAFRRTTVSLIDDRSPNEMELARELGKRLADQILPSSVPGLLKSDLNRSCDRKALLTARWNPPQWLLHWFASAGEPRSACI